MAEKTVSNPNSKLFLFLSTDKDSPISNKYQSPSGTTSTDTCSTVRSLWFNSLSVEEEAHAIAQVCALRELSHLLDQELTPVSVREESQIKTLVQLKSPFDSPFLKRRNKMGFSEIAAPFHDH